MNTDWMDNYTSCGPCASISHCAFCRRNYKDEDIIMQCSQCDRWLHGGCEFLYNEPDIEKVLEKGYVCILCRPKGATPPHLDLNPAPSFEGELGVFPGRTRSDSEVVKEYHKDGVALTTAGLQHIQRLMQQSMGLLKKKTTQQRRRGSVKAVDMEGGVAVDVAPLIDDVIMMKSEQGSDVITGDVTMDGNLGNPGFVGLKQNDGKRRRKPYRPGIGGFNVRQRGRGSYMGSRGRRGRQVPRGSTGFTPELTHDLAPGDPIKMDPTVDMNEGQTSRLVSPLKLKISTLQHKTTKRKKRTRIIDQFPPYIQEGFFGNNVLNLAKLSNMKAIEVVEAIHVEPSHSSSTIVLPERVKSQLDQRVAQRNAEARKKAELKQERLLARRLPSGDEDMLMPESEDLLRVLPGDLEFKEDELLGILAGGLKHQGDQGNPGNILSPSDLETLVTDGLAGMEGDVSSLFSDVLQQDGSANGLPQAAGNSPQQGTVTSSAYDLERTNEILDQISKDDNIMQTNKVKQEETMNQQQQMFENIEQHQIGIQHQQKDMNQHYIGMMGSGHMTPPIMMQQINQSPHVAHHRPSSFNPQLGNPQHILPQPGNSPDRGSSMMKQSIITPQLPDLPR
uniref:histone-lysine N-methyltransferase 2D-like n=1 Tax=Ciona intestinalis TaxID=7719 RepID=UPI000EF44AD3|nr:histone-lysine N-methyltransferase 2D-like [Ciona intestinalis]|eukprot:XP_018672362.2 histone-lysine N-methyltransferase 2D-like [Ciona intestinalis]